MKGFGQSKQKDFAISEPSELLEHAIWKSRVWYSTICPIEPSTPHCRWVYGRGPYTSALPQHTLKQSTHPLNPHHVALP